MKKNALTTNERNNRETWLNHAVRLLRPIFAGAGAPLHDKIRIAVGFPLGGFEKIAGQCFKQEVSRDRHNEIFISPLIDDATKALGVLTHELIHAQDDCKSGHGRAFAKRAETLGLEGKPTHAGAGSTFKQRYATLLERLGPYPHAALRPSKVKRQGTRLLKCECPECGYVCRVTAKWIKEAGAPICPTDRVAMIAELPEEEEE